MKIYGADKSVIMEVSALEVDGSNLVLKGKIFGAMPMKAIVKPQEARQALRLLSFKKVLFLLTLLFRQPS